MVMGDGRRLVATRYCTDPIIVPETMHYTVGNQLIVRNIDKPGDSLLDHQGRQQCILIASEKLSDVESEWHEVPPNHVIMVEDDIHIKVRALNNVG
jgi:glutamine amidotransferase